MSTITKEQEQKIADWLATHELPSGLGNEETACSIASINLALTGRLTDDIPECMSQVIGRWIIRVQDALPYEIRNSAEWKRLLPLAAGTGRKCENGRVAIILDWMWVTVLPQLQPIADARGFGEEWSTMCNEKTAESAKKARDAAADAYAYATYAAATYADAAAAAADANAANAAATYAADAADAYAYAAQFWQKVNPCALLAKLIAVSE